MRKYRSIGLVIVAILFIVLIYNIFNNKYSLEDVESYNFEAELYLGKSYEFILSGVENSIKEVLSDDNDKEVKDKEVKDKEINDKKFNDELDNLERVSRLSERVNVLVLGVEEDPRSDTMIFVSFDTKNEKIDGISIPRDTYYYQKGYESGDHRKINAAYARKREEGAVKAVEDLLGVPIDYYVTVKYEGVVNIVDIIGGVEVNVPEWFNNLPSGKQLLDGKQALVFIRGRKGYSSGDIGRIKAQQEFLKAVAKKALGKKILSVVKEGFKSIKTDMSLPTIIKYALKFKDINEDDVTIHLLPGKFSLDKIGSYRYWIYHHDEGKTLELLDDIYNLEND